MKQRIQINLNKSNKNEKQITLLSSLLYYFYFLVVQHKTRRNHKW